MPGGALASFITRGRLWREVVNVSEARRACPSSFGEVSRLDKLVNPISSGGGGSRYPMEEYARDRGPIGSTFSPSRVCSSIVEGGATEGRGDLGSRTGVPSLADAFSAGLNNSRATSVSVSLALFLLRMASITTDHFPRTNMQ